MSYPKQIFIISHSGAGKAVLAQALAKRLGWKYLDADFSLSPSIGLPLPDILGEQGTQAFQDTLFSILENQLTQESIVVTTDDAVVCSEKSRKLLQSTFTVYLQVSVDVQLKRIGHNRPLDPSRTSFPESGAGIFVPKLRLNRRQ